jgi:alpha-L-fucosidase
VLPSGTKQPTGYRAKYDGKDHAYSGEAGDSIAITGDGWASDSTIKSVGKITQTTHSVVSKDGNTMTLITKTAGGRAVSTRIYAKQ